MPRKKQIVWISAFFFIALPVLLLAGEVNLSETGQMTVYSSGDDGGDIQAGVERTETRFKDSSDGTITDNLTGLIWLKNANCGGAKNWADALTFCNNLASGQCDLSDGSVAGEWHLPNIVELKSLVNAEETNPSAWLNARGFTNVQSSDYWSATTREDDTGFAWGVLMYDGNVSSYFKYYYHYVWPVRSGQ